jgi:hypothetical protein
VQRFPIELWRKKNWLLCHDNAPSRISFLARELLTNKLTVAPQPLPSVPPFWRQNWKSAILTELRWSRQNRSRWWTPSQDTVSRMHLKCKRSTGKGDYIESDGGQ